VRVSAHFERNDVTNYMRDGAPTRPGLDHRDVRVLRSHWEWRRLGEAAFLTRQMRTIDEMRLMRHVPGSNR
jgi:hypothetical protein